MVQRMLDQLQPLMGDVMPNAAICLAMQKKIDAEEQLVSLIQIRQTSASATSKTVARPTQASKSKGKGKQMIATNPLPTTTSDDWQVGKQMIATNPLPTTTSDDWQVTEHSNDLAMAYQSDLGNQQ